MRRRRLAVVLASLSGLPLAFAVAGPASAATITVAEVSGTDRQGPFLVRTLRYEAAPGEANRLAVRSPAGRIELRDAGAPVVVPPECEPLPDGASCPPAQVEVRLGDGDDQLDVDVGASDVVTAFGGAGSDDLRGDDGLGGGLRGGDGDDRLTAGPDGAGLDGDAGADVLIGGPGNDALSGGPGPDTLSAGAGNDQLRGDGAGGPVAADRMDGGDGVDLITYRDHPLPVVVRLGGPEPAGAGSAGENDAISSVESIEGGPRTDRLTGDDGPNRINGGGGPDGDLIEGLGGDDELEGGAGPDRIDAGAGADRAAGEQGDDVIRGGAGDDRLSAGDGTDTVEGGDGDDSIGVGFSDGSRIACGAGADEVGQLEDGDRVTADCERASLEGLGVELSPVPGGLRLRLVAAEDNERRCRGAVRWPGPRIRGRSPQRAFGVEPSGARTVTMRLRRPRPRRPEARLSYRECSLATTSDLIRLRIGF